MKKAILFFILQICSFSLLAQINTDRVLAIGRNALYFEDYVLSIQYFNQVIKSKPWLAEPYFYRAVAKINLDDYKGAEEDCSLCLQRNPFLVQAYYARGIARQSQEKFNEAIADYNKGLEFKAEDRQMLVNKAVANIQRKDYKEAEEVFEVLMEAHPKHSVNYLTRGAMYTEKGDTAKALADYNQAISMDPYYATAYGNRAILLYQTNDLKGALADLNEAIRLNTRDNGYYINRGLVRYQLNDLRGAMADYDQVVSMDSQNQIARFNRGLLRAQVGDNNRAIEDFDVVIQQEPDNYMAYYNRALLRFETGDFRGSVDDFDVVLSQYPTFIPGYYSRSDAKRKMRDEAGADRDYWAAYNMEQQMKKERQAGVSSGNAIASNTNGSEAANPDNKDDNTRQRSDKNIDKFNRLVVYDKEDERKSKYQSEFRGRVQDRNVRVDLEPMFVLTYYEKIDQVKKLVYYAKTIEDYNARMVLGHKLRVTNEEAALTEDQVAVHFASIDNYSSKIERNRSDADAYFARALDFTLVQDFAEAIKDYTKAIDLNPDFAMAYFNRAVVRYKQLDYDRSQVDNADDVLTNMSMNFTVGKNVPTMGSAPKQQDPTSSQMKENKQAYDHEMISRDYDMVIKLNPGFVYAYFNRGNLRCAQRDFRAAVQDYSDAIERDPEFAEAYFNRGLARLSLGDANRGIADLSKSGELGLFNAYSIIKRMTSN